MTALKGGTSVDFSNSMADAIEQEFLKEWQSAKGSALPANQDRSIFFAAIATGILKYLKAHQNEIINTITLDSSSVQTVTALDLNIP